MSLSSKTSSITAGITVADRYQIKALLGRGGMGDVFLALDRLLNQHVAFKILNQEYIHDETHVARFLREIQLSRQLIHPNIVRTLECGQLGSELYFTMEYVEGYSVRYLLRHLQGDVASCIYILDSLAQGLAVVHKAGVVHRDLKPENVLISTKGIVKLTDFGVASTNSSRLTKGSDLVGSMAYLAPELWRGEQLSVAADMYALGITAYEFLTGKVPFIAPTAPQMMYLHLNEAPNKDLLNKLSIPDWLQELILNLLAKDSEKRLVDGSLLIKILDSPTPEKLSIEGCAFIKNKLEELRNSTEVRGRTVLLNAPIHTNIVKVANEINSSSSSLDTIEHRVTRVLQRPPITKNLMLIISILLFSLLVFIAYTLKHSSNSSKAVTTNKHYSNLDNANSNFSQLSGLELAQSAIVWLDTNSLPKMPGVEISDWYSHHTALSANQNIANAQPKTILEDFSGRVLLDFNGRSTFLDLSVFRERFSDLKQFSFQVIAKLKHISRPQYILTVYGQNKDDDIFRFGFNAEQGLGILTHRASGATKVDINSSPLLLNELSIYTLIWGDNQISVFQNGKRILLRETAFPMRLASSYTISLGQEWDLDLPSDFLEGQIGDLLIFNRALGEEERHILEKFLAERYKLPNLEQ